MTKHRQVVIIGAGPAGVRAAETLVQEGVQPIVLDEGALWGGQIYRQPLPSGKFKRSKRTLYGFEWAKADHLHQTMARLQPLVDYRPETVVWNVEEKSLDVLSKGELERVPFTHLIIASGATDRILPLPGWTLPGCFTMGGAQIALKAYGCAIGRKVVFAGTGPLLYLVAYQYAKAGAHVVAVLDTSDWSRQRAAVPRLLHLPGVFAKGLYYLAALRRRGVRVERNVRLLGLEGQESVEGIRWTYRNAKPGTEENIQQLECDAVGIGYGLRPETQLADVARCRFVYSERDRCWIPETDAAGRTSVAGIYVAGDGASIAGADAAELAGKRAGLAVLHDLDVIAAQHDALHTMQEINRKLDRITRFREGIEHAFPMPEGISTDWPDDLTICRCEEVSAGTLRTCIQAGGITEINRLKAVTRVGMGRCQGRMCGTAATVLMSDELGLPLKEVGRLRAQAPIKPLPAFCQSTKSTPSSSV